LYKRQILGAKQETKEPLTTVFVDHPEYDFGTLRKGSKNEGVFSIQNTGDHPFVIYRVSTSCGCTQVEWDKQPIEPGRTTELKVEMTPDETGYFNKSLVVYGNVESPVKLTISGTVE
jgi:hypothetical protein